MFDSHVHLQDPRFDTCRNAVIAAAIAAGVRGACCCGTAPKDWEAVAVLAEGGRWRGAGGECRVSGVGWRASENEEQRSETAPGGFPRSPFFILPAFGVHPWYADPLPADWMERLESLLALHPEAPVGEIGLDGIRAFPSREPQRQVLCAQLELAIRLRRPVVLHGARAWGELTETLRPFAPRLPGFVGHAFGGSAEVLREWVALGGFLSFAGTVCNPMARRIRAAAVAAPADRLLIETDAPDLKPGEQKTGDRSRETGDRSLEPKDGIPGEINHPANLPLVARAVAQLRTVSEAEIALLTRVNAGHFFGFVSG